MGRKVLKLGVIDVTGGKVVTGKRSSTTGKVILKGKKG